MILSAKAKAIPYTLKASPSSSSYSRQI
jgi:hypothetical protein